MNKMTKLEAQTLLETMAIEITRALGNSGHIIMEQTKLLRKQLKAIDMAIEALEKPTEALEKPTEALEKPTEAVTDCISRERAIEIVKRAETKEIAYLALINLEPKEIPICDECRLPECLADKQDDWTPVSEPPKENGKYLVSVDGYWKFVGIFKYDVVKETWYALDKEDNYGTDWNKRIVAWQPLPKLYRK